MLYVGFARLATNARYVKLVHPPSIKLVHPPTVKTTL